MELLRPFDAEECAIILELAGNAGVANPFGIEVGLPRLAVMVLNTVRLTVFLTIVVEKESTAGPRLVEIAVADAIAVSTNCLLSSTSAELVASTFGFVLLWFSFPVRVLLGFFFPDPVIDNGVAAAGFASVFVTVEFESMVQVREALS